LKSASTLRLRASTVTIRFQAPGWARHRVVDPNPALIHHGVTNLNDPPSLNSFPVQPWISSLHEAHENWRRKIKSLPFIVAAVLSLVHASPALAEADFEETTARYQTTYNWQRHPAFRSPYSGLNSLSAGKDQMFTFSLTAHWGTRLWSGGELYFNPELAAGVPFTDSLVGLGGFTNGEITRAAGSTPKPYRQRLFLRHTWNQGGGTVKVDADLNQLAGTVDRDRTVLTLGNFSTLDVFDDNAYAKDPRTQFMNWGNWTYSSWDYAADARGFGWGFALEFYRENWVYRLGRMTGPKDPNGLALDFDLLKHYGDQFELERTHTFNEQPGALRILAYRNRAVLARFDDATAYLLANNPLDKQTFFWVRNGEQVKQGLGVNLEQALDSTIGVFFRAMRSDGKTETYAFTEVDQSLSGGVLIKGHGWGRADDMVGLSLMTNHLSSERRRFLEAGGISYFIGDGQLHYKPERIFEGFYSWAVAKGFWLTGDYQRIQNPAYNANRGPVDVFALRLHARFQ